MDKGKDKFKAEIPGRKSSRRNAIQTFIKPDLLHHSPKKAKFETSGIKALRG